MENTTKPGIFNFVKTRILKGIILILWTFVISHGPVMGEYFPSAVALVSYMVYRNPSNIYLAIPAAGGIVPYIAKGMDPWGDLAAVVICGIIMAAAGKIKLSLAQAAFISGSAGIICVSISRLATVTVYKISVEKLLLDGVLIFVLVFAFDAAFSIWENRGVKKNFSVREIPLMTVVSICIMLLNGAGLSFIIWPAVIFLVLVSIVYLDPGQAFLTAASGGIWAALAGQAQWGFMITAIIGITAAIPAKKAGNIICAAVFVAVCCLLERVDSGIVLGIDGYCIFIAAASFAAISWKAGKKLKRIAMLSAGSYRSEKEISDKAAAEILKEKACDMADLAELYSTYLDSRSVLAGQFEITRQIMDNTRRSINMSSGRTAVYRREKMDIDVAVSQCAASGTINGDCCGWQEIGDGKVVLIVSDGMGKGKKAAAESLMVTKTIISLLKSGVTADLTLKMINTVMLMKDDEESYATVDLVIIDKRSCKAKFYKIGAAPTLIRRKELVDEVKLSAVPLGIVNGLKIRYLETSLKKGDWIIMMSDGVSEGGITGGGGGRFLGSIKETAAKVRSGDPQTMSDLILNRAADSYIGRERDDLTVLVARII